MEVYNLPIKLREWFVNRLVQQKQDEEAAMNAASQGKSSAPRSQSLNADNAPTQIPYTKPR